MQGQSDDNSHMGAESPVQAVDGQILGVIKAVAAASESEGLGMLAQLHHLFEVWEQRARGQQPQGEGVHPLPLPECDASSSTGGGRRTGLKRQCTLVPHSFDESNSSAESTDSDCSSSSSSSNSSSSLSSSAG